MKSRYHHIDLVEMIAIFFVVLYHSTLYKFDFTEELISVGHIRYFLRTILSTCVPLFFFTNGYLLLNRPVVMKKHIVKMVRYSFLIIVWGILLMLIYALIKGDSISFKFALQKVLILNTKWGMNVFWYLCTLIAVYALYPAFKALYDSNVKYFAYCTVLITLISFGIKFANFCLTYSSVVFGDIFGNFHFNQPLIELMNPFKVTYGFAFAYFCLGGLFYKLEDKILQVPPYIRNIISSIGIFLSCVGLFLTGIIYSSDESIWDVVWDGYDTIYTLFNVIFIYIISLNFKSDIPIIKMISCNTLGIYFTHGIIIRSTRDIIVSQWPFLCTFVGNMAYSAVIVMICLFMCYLIKKIPVVRKLL